MPVIHATQEVDVGESRSEAGIGQSRRPYLKEQTKNKELGHRLKS
jgi:hypothetical protein